MISDFRTVSSGEKSLLDPFFNYWVWFIELHKCGRKQLCERTKITVCQNFIAVATLVVQGAVHLRKSSCEQPRNTSMFTWPLPSSDFRKSTWKWWTNLKKTAHKNTVFVVSTLPWLQIRHLTFCVCLCLAKLKMIFTLKNRVENKLTNKKKGAFISTVTYWVVGLQTKLRWINNDNYSHWSVQWVLLILNKHRRDDTLL